MNDNIYSSSAFIHLLKVKYNIGLQKLHVLTGESIYSLQEIRKGRKQLGLDLYSKIKRNLNIDEVCDYNNSYEPYKDNDGNYTIHK